MYGVWDKLRSKLCMVLRQIELKFEYVVWAKVSLFETSHLSILQNDEKQLGSQLSLMFGNLDKIPPFQLSRFSTLRNHQIQPRATATYHVWANLALFQMLSMFQIVQIQLESQLPIMHGTKWCVVPHV